MTTQYPTHPLYSHFKSWIDMEDDYQDSYYIINTSLYAAEQYIENTYNIITTPSNIKEYFGEITETDKVYPSYAITNLLDIFINNSYALPTIKYVENGQMLTYEGKYDFEKRKNTLKNIEGDTTINYVTGWVYPPNVAYISNIPEDVDDGEVSTPKLYLEDDSPISQVVNTTAAKIRLKVIGDPASTIYINGTQAILEDDDGAIIDPSITPNITINESRIGMCTLTLNAGANTFNITLRDSYGTESKIVNIVVNRQDTTTKPKLVILGKTFATVDGTYTLTVMTEPGASIEVDGTVVIPSADYINTITGTLATEGTHTLSIKATTTGSTFLTTTILYDTNLPIPVIEWYESNSNDLSNVVMPQDLLMAILMIAHHYFKAALYKHDETHSYGDNVSNRTTFIKERFPKDAQNILSRYVRY